MTIYKNYTNISNTLRINLCTYSTIVQDLSYLFCIYLVIFIMTQLIQVTLTSPSIIIVILCVALQFQHHIASQTSEMLLRSTLNQSVQHRTFTMLSRYTLKETRTYTKQIQFNISPEQNYYSLLRSSKYSVPSHGLIARVKGMAHIPSNAKRKCIATETGRERWKRQFAESPGNVVTLPWCMRTTSLI